MQICSENHITKRCFVKRTGWVPFTTHKSLIWQNYLKILFV